MSEVMMTAIGYLSQDPRIGHTNSGRRVGNATVPHTPRKYNRDTSAWEDSGETLWVEATVWGDAVDILEGLVKGDKVRVDGTPVLETFKRRDGSEGAKLTLASASVALLERKSSRESRQEPRTQANGVGGDPWSQAAQKSAQAGAQQAWPDTDEPPF